MKLEKTRFIPKTKVIGSPVEMKDAWVQYGDGICFESIRQ